MFCPKNVGKVAHILFSVCSEVKVKKIMYEMIVVAFQSIFSPEIFVIWEALNCNYE